MLRLDSYRVDTPSINSRYIFEQQPSPAERKIGNENADALSLIFLTGFVCSAVALSCLSTYVLPLPGKEMNGKTPNSPFLPRRTSRSQFSSFFFAFGFLIFNFSSFFGSSGNISALSTFTFQDFLKTFFYGVFFKLEKIKKNKFRFKIN